MKVHSEEKIQRLKKLRSRGYSINELVEKLVIPKTTVWHHIQNVPVERRYLPTLISKRGGSTKRKQKNLQMASERARALLRSQNRDLCVAIAMLYWGEGSKKSCEFINSDGRMIRAYLAILKKLFDIRANSTKVTIRIFSGMNRKNCLDYWEDITNVARKKFIVRLNDGGIRGKTKYGMCRITVRKGGNTLKLMHALIEQLFDEIIKKCPRSSMD